MEILCNEEGARVSTGLSRYFGDTVQTISEAVVNENTFASAAYAGGDALRQDGEQLLLSDLITPAQVGQRVFFYKFYHDFGAWCSAAQGRSRPTVSSQLV